MKEEEKNNPLNKIEEQKNGNEEENNNNNNNKSNSLSESISGSNTYNEEDDKITKLKNQLNFLIETLNYEQAIILCKKILFFTPDDLQIYKTLWFVGFSNSGYSYIGNKLFESFCSRGFTSGCIEKKCIHVFCVERKRQNNNTSESR